METIPFAALGLWVGCALLAVDLFFRLRAHQREEEAAREPNPPLHKEYAGRHEIEAINKQIQSMREERSRSVGNLHQRIEALSIDNRSITSDLRKEMKDDVRGLHTRINDVATAVAELGGALTTALKNSHHPFSK